MNCLNITLRSLKEDSELLRSQKHPHSHEIKAIMIKERSYDQMLSGIETNSSTTQQRRPLRATSNIKKSCHCKSKSFQLNDCHRQNMCEWSFRVVDHFGGSRELVAIAINYLDRFLNNFNCDLEEYKLAFITCLCLSIKVHNNKPLSMKSLSTLSSGEFSQDDIVEMESSILNTLEWNLCPPTSTSFCHHFHLLLSKTIPKSMTRSILEKSCFYCELSLFQGNLSSLKPSEVAFAATLNAIHGMDKAMISMDQRQKFIQYIEQHSGMKHDDQSIRFARKEILSLYKRSKQFISEYNKFFSSPEDSRFVSKKDRSISTE